MLLNGTSVGECVTPVRFPTREDIAKQRSAPVHLQRRLFRVSVVRVLVKP